MAEAASSCASSQSRPLLSASSSDSNPASPRTPLICQEGRLDSTAEECCCATTPPLSPFAAAVEKERSSREHDAARSLIERLDDGWFRENVVSCRWGHSSPPSAKVVDGYSAGAARDRLAEESASSHGIRTPDATGLSASQRELIQPPPFRSIEMVPPLVTSRSFSGERDTRESRDLPRTRLRRLSRRPGSMDDADTFFFGSEQKQCTMDDTFNRFGEMRIEPSRLGRTVRSIKPEDVVVPSRPFSDGDERTGEVNEPLSDVREEGESASEDKPPSKNQVSRQLVMPAKLAPIEAGKELRNPLTDRNLTKAPPLRPRRRRDRKKRSKSSTDVDFDEMRGWMDLGFKINEDDLTPRPLPGLKDNFKGGDDSLFDSPRGMASPKGWPRRPDSPLFKWPIPAANGSNDDMREHLKQWAHYVASSVVSAEC